MNHHRESLLICFGFDSQSFLSLLFFDTTMAEEDLPTSFRRKGYSLSSSPANTGKEMQDLQAQTQEQEGDETSLDHSMPGDAAEGEGQQHGASSPSTKAQAPLSLSKSWSVRKAHVPLYTGGSIQHCPSHNVLLTPVGGDVAVVDCAAGVQLCTVRRGNSSNYNNNNNNEADAEEEEDDQLDADAITAYAVNQNENLLLTCSHNSFLRQYVITSTTERQQEDADADADHDQQQQQQHRQQRKVKILLQKTWGKSGHTLPVTDMQFHRSGVFVATASVDGSVRIWDVRGGFVTHVYRPGSSSSNTSGMMRAVTALQWFPDVQQLVLAIGRDDGSIAIHNLRDSSSQQQQQAAEASSGVVVLRDHVSAVTCLGWDTDRSVFVSTGRDAVINLWRYHYESSSSNENAAGTSSSSHKKKTKKRKPKSQQQTTAGNTTPTYRRIHTLPIYEQVEGMVLLKTQDNESLLATAGTKGQIRLWKMTQVQTNEDENGIDSYQLSLFSAQSVSETFGEARGGYVNLRYSDNRQFKDVTATSSSSSAAEQLIVADAEHNITFVNLSPLLTTSTTTNKDAGTVLTTDRTIVGHNDEILDLKVIPHSQQKVVVATNSAQVRIFDLNSFSCEHVLDRHSATVLCVDVSPCGRFIATCGKDKQMRIWRQQATTTTPPSTTRVVWQCVAVASGHTEAVGSTAFSRKVGRYEVCGKAARNGGGAFVVTASMDRTLKRWNLPGAKDLLLLLLEPKEVSARANNADVRAAEEQQLDLKTFASTRAHEKDINIVSVAPNDSLIATGSQDKTVKLWKANTLSLVATLKGHRRGVWDCQFSPFDRVLATGSGDKAIKLWSLSDFSCVRTFQGHVASVLRVRFLSGGLQLVSSGADGLVKLWTVRTNECEATMDAHKDKIWALDLDATGKQLISGGADSQIVVWEDTTKEVEDAKRFEEEEAILVEQKLANHLRHKEYAEALEISLERDKPYQTLKVLNAIIENDLQKGDCGLASLKVYASKWSTDRIVRVLRYCREWNTRAQNSHVALLVVKAIVSTVPVHTLAATDGVPEILAGIIPYAERHFERLDRLHSSSYLLDFALSSMGVIEASDEEQDFAVWESSAKLVLPPKRADGRVDVGGSIVVGASLNDPMAESSSDDDYDEQDEEVITIGDSDSDEE